MIDVGLAAHLPARALDKHADSISLLLPRLVKKNRRDIPAAALGEMPSWVTGSSPAGSPPVASAARTPLISDYFGDSRSHPTKFQGVARRARPKNSVDAAGGGEVGLASDPASRQKVPQHDRAEHHLADAGQDEGRAGASRAR